MNGSRAWVEKDFYEVLGVSETASADEIKRAYKKLATTHHPDRNPGDKAAEERMKDVSEAYGVLKDAEKRTEYDNVRRMARGGFGTGGFSSTGGFQGGIDLNDLFGGIFGGGRARAAPRRGADLQTSVRLSFEDAFHGVTLPVRVRREVSCSACAGSGDASGRATTCGTCGGAGAVAESQGMFAVSRTCPACGGTGRTVTDPCKTCRGSGLEARADEVKVKIPAGIADGARIRVRGRGGAVAGGPTGDLYVNVSVEKHPLFGRKGHDLTLTMPVSYPAAALGAKVSVPTMDAPVTLKIPAGTQPGKTFRVRGRGVTAARGPGDLLVTVQVAVPTKISKQERTLLEELAQLNGAAAEGGSDG